MIVFRLTKAQFKNDLSGKGAEINGGRWNSKGTRILYACANRALCTTEIAVHTPLGIIPKNYFLQTIEFPDNGILELQISRLHKEWSKFPHHPSSKVIGDSFVKENNHLSLKVPSAIVQDEFNYLINPNHTLFNKVKIIKNEKFTFDKRLFIKN